jgi:hypothetical protein
MAAAERNGTIRYLDCEPADGITVAARNRDFGTSPGSSTIKLHRPCGEAEGGMTASDVVDGAHSRRRIALGLSLQRITEGASPPIHRLDMGTLVPKSMVS